MSRGCTPAAAFCLLALFVHGASAQGVPNAGSAKATLAKADVATLLFEQPMWRRAPAGVALRYGFARRTGPKTLGASFDDDILVTLGPGDDAESRTAEIRMFSGTHAREAGPFFSSKLNPLLAVVMEQNVQELGRLTGLEPARLREDIRKAWRDDVRIVDMPLSVAGRQVPGLRITVTPFGTDPAREKMKGLDTLTYAVEISDSVPGRIARIDIRTAAGRAPIFSETLRYMGSRRR